MIRAAGRLFGVALLCLSIGLVGFLVWEFFGSNIPAQHRQKDLVREYREAQQIEGSTTMKHIKTQAILRIPALGKDYAMPVLDGTSDRVLDSGVVGHFPTTANAGQEGNYALIAHRVTHGEPFRNLPSMHEGDKIFVDKDGFTYTYLVTRDPFVVDMSETWVIGPKPKSTVGKSLITLVTCASLFHTNNRTIVFGTLVKTS